MPKIPTPSEILFPRDDKGSEWSSIPEQSVLFVQRAFVMAECGENLFMQGLLKEGEIRGLAQDISGTISRARLAIDSSAITLLLEAAHYYKEAMDCLKVLGNERELETVKISLSDVISAIGRNLENIDILQHACDLLGEVLANTNDEEIITFVRERISTLRSIFDIIALKQGTKKPENPEVVVWLSELLKDQK